MITIPVFLFHATVLFCDVKRKILLWFVYMQGFCFILFIPSGFFLKGVKWIFSEIYYPVLGPVYHVFLAAWVLIVFISQWELLRLYKKASGLRKTQVTYLFVGLMVGFVGGGINFLTGYSTLIYPFGNILIPLYGSIVTYAILKYRLLDISLVIARGGIFIAVYSMVLGIPFIIAFGWKEPLRYWMGEIWWIAPLISSTILATAGPSIYFYVQQRAEGRILREQRRYQATLRRASLGMGRIKDLRKLLDLTVHIVTKAVRIEHCAVYLLHQDAGKFVLKAFKRTDTAAENIAVPLDAPLIRSLQRQREPLVYDEVKQKSIDLKDETLDNARATMEDMGAALVVPSFIENHLIAFLVLGRKKSGKPYSHDDLMVFSILANQAALAIENAQFYEEMKKTHEQLVKAEKMATIGTMVDGLSHQINNRLHAIGFIAGDALDTVQLKEKTFPPQAQEVLKEIAYAFDRIQDNVKRGGEIVEGMLKYSRKADEGFGAVALDKLVGASLEMARFKMKLNQIDIVRNFNHSTPNIRGNFTQLQEVLFNIIDNAYDAMMQRREELAEEGYKGRLEITAADVGENLEILITDNGIGVGEKDLKRLFTPFFTTKLSSRKGMGLGLYVMRKIIEENHGGRIEFESEHKKGSRIRVLLPIAASL